MDEYADFLDELIEQGAFVYIDDLDEYGEKMIRMVPERLKELCEPLYMKMTADYDRELLELVDEGILDMQWNDEDNEFEFILTEEGYARLHQ